MTAPPLGRWCRPAPRADGHADTRLREPCSAKLVRLELDPSDTSVAPESFVALEGRRREPSTDSVAFVIGWVLVDHEAPAATVM